MIIVLSPAKKLDYSEETRFTQTYTQPDHQESTHQLVDLLAGKSAGEIGELMKLSEKLSTLNYDRYQNFTDAATPQEAKQALLSFKGDVYLSFELEKYTEADFAFAQQHLRILSGLYGLLRPLDLIQPYRLEMGTRLANPRGKNLYEFWKTQITEALAQALALSGSDTLVNLASNEYFKAIDQKKLPGKVIHFSFKDDRNGEFKPIFLFVKQARGHMADFAIQHRITDPEELKKFDRMGYQFHEALSEPNHWVFTR